MGSGLARLAVAWFLQRSRFVRGVFLERILRLGVFGSGSIRLGGVGYGSFKETLSQARVTFNEPTSLQR